MTLVELLVVIAILGLLLAVSVPIIKPLLEARRTSNAAQVLAGAFQQARLKSMQEQRSYGVRLIPFENAPTVSVQLQLEVATTQMVTINPPDVRVRVENGFIVPYRFCDDDGWREIEMPSPEREEILELFQEGYEVQFNRLGRSLVIGKDYRLAAPYESLCLPEETLLSSNEEVNDAMEFRIVSLVKPLVSWQTVMPHGTVVDLAFSGGETLNFDSGDKKFGDLPYAFLPLPPNEQLTAVTVMFSPSGHVDVVGINYIDSGGEGVKLFQVNEMLYFCVGEWDRQVDTGGNPLAEDKKTNLEASATYWVSLHPKTGGTRITENAAIQPGNPDLRDWLHDARRFAREHFFNVGGR